METTVINSMCRCCASEGAFKDIKRSYQWMGDEEVYGEMLKECFDVDLSSTEDSEGGICEVCITQLRNASNFKKQVLQTEEQFKKQLQMKFFKPAVVKVEMQDDNNQSDDNISIDDSFSSPEYDLLIKKETAEETKPKKRGAAAKAGTSRAKKSKAIEDSDFTSTSKQRVKAEESAEERNLSDAEVSTEISDDNNLGKSANFTLKSDKISTHFTRSQIINTPSNLQCETPTSTLEDQNCFLYNKKGQDVLNNISAVHGYEIQHAMDTPNNNPVSSKEITNIVPLTVKNNQTNTNKEQKNVNKLQINTNTLKQNKKRLRLPDFCFYCEKQVHSFSRHLIRNHTVECEVQKILSIPKRKPERKKLLSDLRKKGNYKLNTAQCIKPIKRSAYSTADNYLPCTECLGFYSRSQLWKHRKICTENNSDSFSQADAQNFLVRNLEVDDKLKSVVFPRMRADKVSLTAKRDFIICAFGAQYLKTHRDKHYVNVVSRRMRELAKLLIEVKKNKPQVQDLFSALKPEYYDAMVTATKNCAKYNEEKDLYITPSFAMSISTSLKQCCNIAIMKTIKTRNGSRSAEIEVDLKTFIQLIEENWKYDVSSRAADDLNIKKWNKITIVPVVSDMKLLKNHLTKLASTSCSKLAHAEFDIAAYIDLMETIFCRVLLLNRRRPGELQRLLLDTYKSAEDTQNKCEKFDRGITLTERVLIKSLKCVVIRVKRGRGVPVLFTPDVQDDLKVLINARDKYIEKGNPFLFVRPACNTLICGYKVIGKHALLCKATNPKVISSTRLRKHLATLTQLFHMTKNQIEQLANFMGHKSAVRRQSHRLPDDIDQTAKIANLLMLMEEGKADAYKGKNLDEINFNFDEKLVEDDIDTEEMFEREEYLEQTVDVYPETSDVKQKGISLGNKPIKTLNQTNLKTSKKRTIVPWTTEQKSTVLAHFKTHVKTCRPPKKGECLKLKKLYPDILSNKDWLKIKVFIQNIYSKK